MIRETYPSDGAATGVARPLPPRKASCASRSFCSRASARRLRKSESATRPTVCVLRRSSAVLVCEVKRGLGVELPEDVIFGSCAAMLAFPLRLKGNLEVFYGATLKSGSSVAGALWLEHGELAYCNLRRTSPYFRIQHF